MKLLAVDATTGKLESWDPHPNSVHGVFALASGGTVVAAGGDFTKVDGVRQQGFAAFSQ